MDFIERQAKTTVSVRTSITTGILEQAGHFIHAVSFPMAILQQRSTRQHHHFPLSILHKAAILGIRNYKSVTHHRHQETSETVATPLITSDDAIIMRLLRDSKRQPNYSLMEALTRTRSISQHPKTQHDSKTWSHKIPKASFDVGRCT